MLTKRAEIIVGDFVTLVNVATDGADVLFLLGFSYLGLGFYFCVILRIGQGRGVFHDDGIGQLGNKQNVTAKIQVGRSTHFS